MELINEFTVQAPLERAWSVLIDLETIAPCLPGAQLQEIEGDEYRGIVKVKVGPITAQYKGKATFVEMDEAARRVVLRADGRDTRGQGNASALITAELVAAAPEVTTVTVSTDLTVTGKVAQFGRGVMADISAKLMDQFAVNLSAIVSEDPAAPDAPGTSDESAADPASASAPPAVPDEEPRAEEPRAGEPRAGEPPAPSVRTLDLSDVAPVDLLETAGGPMLRRVVPALGFLGLILVLIRLFGARKKQ